MAKKVTSVAKNLLSTRKGSAKSLEMFERGIKNATELCCASVAVGADLIAGRISPTVGNAVGGQMRNVLKAAELQLKYGAPTHEGGSKILSLA